MNEFGRGRQSSSFNLKSSSKNPHWIWGFEQKINKEQLAGSMIDLRNTGKLVILTIILSRSLLIVSLNIVIIILCWNSSLCVPPCARCVSSEAECSPWGPRYWPLIGWEWSRDQNTVLWLAECSFPGDIRAQSEVQSLNIYKRRVWDYNWIDTQLHYNNHN